jgi:uncharacterized lipoprotein YddW (UPF0748 family)
VRPIRLLLALCALLLTVEAPRAQSEMPREVRGVWIPAPQHTGLWSSKQSIAREMEYYASRGFNVVFPVVWVDGYTLYPSEVMRERFGVAIHPALGQSRHNMLRELIVEARRVGLEVMPWYEYGFATHYGDSGGHILQARPDWAWRDRTGNLAMQYRDPGTGTGFTWMNGINPEVQDFMLDLIRELVETYDVDGVQGDDRLPALPAVGGYDDFTVALYRQEHGGQDPPANWADIAWRQWRADKLTAFGGRLYDVVKEVDPNLTVSMSPSIYPFSIQNYLQDWPAWLNAGQVDIIHPQAYRWNDVNLYKDLIRQMVGSVPGSPAGYVAPEHRHRLSPGIVALVGSQVNPPAYFVEAVRFNREMGIMGEVYFFNEGLRARNAHAADSLFKYHYHTPALMPGREGLRRPPPVIVNLDEEAVTLDGEWTVDPAIQGFAGPMRFAQKGTGSRITYALDVPHPGHYDVYAYQPPNAFATRTAHYTLAVGEEETVTVIDQLGATNTGWVSVGTVHLTPGAGGTLVLDADAVTDPDTRLHRTYGEAVLLVLNRRLTPDLFVEAPPVGAEEGPSEGGGLRLAQNYPNPFRDGTAIRFTLDRPAEVSVRVYDPLGRRVATLLEGAPHEAGAHEVRAELGHLAPGVYLYRVEAAGAVRARAMVRLR